jgi:hypothetical protein
MKTADLSVGDTVFQTVLTSPEDGQRPFVRHILVTGNEPGTVVHGPGTIRVRELAGTDKATGQTVRWTAPGAQLRAAYRPLPPEPVQEAAPVALDPIQRMLASVGR